MESTFGRPYQRDFRHRERKFQFRLNRNSVNMEYDGISLNWSLAHSATIVSVLINGNCVSGKKLLSCGKTVLFSSYEPPDGIDNRLLNVTKYSLQCRKPSKDDQITNPCKAALAPCLFDVETDPCEQYNIAHVFPNTTEMLMSKIRKYNESAVQSIVLRPDPRAKGTGLIQPWIL